MRSLIVAFLFLALPAYGQVLQEEEGDGGKISTSSPATAYLYYQITSASSGPDSLGITGSNYVLPSAEIEANDTIVLSATVPSGTTVTPSDTLGLTWPAAVCSADSGSGNLITRIFV